MTHITVPLIFFGVAAIFSAASKEIFDGKSIELDFEIKNEIAQLQKNYLNLISRVEKVEKSNQILKEKNQILEEKNQILEEKNQILEKKNQILEESNQVLIKKTRGKLLFICIHRYTGLMLRISTKGFTTSQGSHFTLIFKVSLAQFLGNP